MDTRRPISRSLLKTLLLLLVSYAGEAVAQDVTFNRITIDAGRAGDLKRVADINGDGFPDLIVGGFANSEPLVWYRYPDWQKFQIANAQNEFTTDGEVADMDGDGDIDIIAPDLDISLYWYENPGGSDAEVQANWIRHPIYDIPGGEHNKDTYAGDYDGNGRMDVAVREHAAIKILFQTGANTWIPKTLASGLSGEGLGRGDVDGDGDLDIIGRGVWYENPGGDLARTGTWISRTVTSASQSAGPGSAGGVDDEFRSIVADIDSDGRNDILWSGSEGTAQGGQPMDVIWCEWVTNPDILANWTCREIVNQLNQAHTLQAADFDNDGDQDVLTGQMHTTDPHELAIWYNANGTGMSWTKQVVDSGEGNESGVHIGIVADIGNDGDYDIWAVNWAGNPPARLYENQLNPQTGGGLPLDEWTYIGLSSQQASTFGLDFSDVNGDGRRDVISGRYWFRNPGGDLSGAWTRNGPFPNDAGSENIHAYLAADVDGDANVDLIGTSTSGSRVLWLESSNGGTDWTVVLVGTLPAASHTLGQQGHRLAQIVAGDRLEILFSSGNGNVGSGGVYYFQIPSSNPQAGNWPKVRITNRQSDETFSVCDINGDGNLDVAGVTGFGGTVEWWEHPGSTNPDWSAHTIDSAFPGGDWPDRVECADVSGDGKVDVLVTAETGVSSGSELYKYTQGSTVDSWTRATITSQGSLNNLDAADMDEDGDIDAITAEHRGSLKLMIFENNGSGTLAELEIDRGKECHDAAQTVDLEGDGDLEIVCIAWDTPQLVHLWRNDARAPSVGTNNPPSIAISSPSSGATFASGAAITLQAASSDADGSVTKVEFFADGVKLGEDASAPYSFTWNGASTGVHSLTARAIDDDDAATTSAAVNITVNAPANQAPTASFTANPTSGTAPLAVSFNGSASSDPEGSTLMYNWNFGDGSTGTGAVVSHTFTTGGSYTVTLTVGDGQTSDDAQTTIQVDTPTGSGGIVAHWRLDESAGSVADDAVGSNNGTLTGGPIWRPSGGQIGGALDFDGVDDRVALGNLDVSGGTGLTIAFWMNAGTLTNNDARFISKASGTQEADHYWMVSTVNTTGLRFRLKTGGTTSMLATAAGQVQAGAWYYVAVTYDGGNMRIYKDGVQVASAGKSGTISTSTSVPVALGSQPQGGSAFDGLLDDVRIYNRALSAAELQAVMAEDPGGGSTTQSIPLLQGWNLVSGYVAPEQAAMPDVFSGMAANTVIVKNGDGQVFYPSQSINTIGDWDWQDGYAVYMTAPATLQLEGSQVVPDPMPLLQGWNWLSYPRNAAMAPDQALASILPHVVLLKNGQGEVYLPEHGIDQIGAMEPGMGYKLYIWEAAMLTYPASGAAFKATPALMAGEGAVPAIASSANIVVDAPGFQEGAVITAWAGDRQVGSGTVSGGKAVVLVYGDDPFTEEELEGARTGEAIALKHSDVLVRMAAARDVFSEAFVTEIAYGEDALWAVTVMPGEVAVKSELGQNVPNPVILETVIEYGLEEASQVRLEIFNALGQLVRVLVDEPQEAGVHRVPFHAGDLPSGIYVYRLEAGGFTEAKVMVVAK
jgi:PKD repeat protein